MIYMQVAECANDPVVGYIFASAFPIFVLGIIAVVITGMVKS